MSIHLSSRILTSVVLSQVSLIGFETEWFVESELKIVDSLSDSVFLHHLEPPCYDAVRTDLDSKETSLSLPSTEKFREKQSE